MYHQWGSAGLLPGAAYSPGAMNVLYSTFVTLSASSAAAAPAEAGVWIMLSVSGLFLYEILSSFQH